MATHSSFIPGRLHGQRHPMRSKKSDMTEHTHTPTHTENLKRKKEPALGSIMCARSIQGYFLN